LNVPGTTGNSLVTRFEVHLSELRSSVETTLTGMTLPRGLEEVPIATQQVSARVAQEDMDTRLLTGKSTDSILSASTASSIENDLRLAALFRRRPESVPLAVTRLTAGGAGSQAIAGALAEANTPASVQALRKVAQDPARVTAVRVSSLGALAGMKEPSVEAMQIPVVLFGDRNPQVRNAARLAGGALARAGRETHGVESDAIEVDLAGRFGRAATLDEKKELLSALGNSAGPRAATVLAAAMKDPREDVRTSATRSLRLIPGASTDGLLAEIAKADSSATVRGAALFAISFRVPLTVTLWDAVLEAARSDASASVRNQAISLLRSDPRRPPETETTLAWIAQHDPEPVFRRLANDALAAIRSSPAVR